MRHVSRLTFAFTFRTSVLLTVTSRNLQACPHHDVRFPSCGKTRDREMPSYLTPCLGRYARISEVPDRPQGKHKQNCLLLASHCMARKMWEQNSTVFVLGDALLGGTERVDVAFATGPDYPTTR